MIEEEKRNNTQRNSVSAWLHNNMHEHASVFWCGRTTSFGRNIKTYLKTIQSLDVYDVYLGKRGFINIVYLLLKLTMLILVYNKFVVHLMCALYMKCKFYKEEEKECERRLF